jgi:hypothetical protein
VICKHCGLNHPRWPSDACFNTFIYIYERDLLECARRWPGWRDKAYTMGFRDAYIDSPWQHKDEGRRLELRRIDAR